MSRYLLDTNIVIFLVLAESDSLAAKTNLILNENGNQLATSSICVMEIIQLYRIGKIKTKKYKTVNDLCAAIEQDFYIKILPFAKPQLQVLSKLKVADNHNDPFDHAIISHAIADKLTLVSSDRKFTDYTKQNLNFVFNKR